MRNSLFRYFRHFGQLNTVEIEGHGFKKFAMIHFEKESHAYSAQKECSKHKFRGKWLNAKVLFMFFINFA